MLRRDHWRGVNDRLDPVRDSHEITSNLSTREFPWDTIQALSFALFRTYAVPSIGRLLAETGEFTHRVQKRYDDTGLLLEAISEHGLDDPRGKAAVRRINRMHGAYPISNDDMRYVLSTFVVVPKRWLDDYGYRPLTANERAATTEYYRRLGRHLGIKDIPEDFAAFEQLLDDYERAHFGHDARARTVADATLDLMTTFPPNNLLPKPVMRRFARALMDDPLLDAFGYPRPGRVERRVARGALKARGRLLRLAPARQRQKFARDFGYFRSYPGGHLIEDLGTFPAGSAAG
jgi:ER-bound oxygenase mpaB/B'/Rubber oxygenase, catalytic domain